MAIPISPGKVRATGTRAGLPGASHSEDVRYRISKRTGFAMITTAILFDLLPIILALMMLFAAFQGGGGPQEAPDTPWWNVYQQAKDFVQSIGDAAEGAVVAVLSIVVFAPLAYVVGSLLAPFLALLVFTLWFFMKGVNPFSITGLLIMFIEFVPIPFANILPGITVVVWRRVRASRREDEVRSGSGASSLLPG